MPRQYHRARRRFSQNFLIDRGYIDRIVRSIAPRKHDHIVEIGPGRGALTEPLSAAVNQMDVIEIDRDEVHLLKQRYSREALTIHCADVLAFDFRSIGNRLRIVGNLPYHISTPILFAVDAIWDSVRDCHFMLQKEVVDRMGAAPATPEYGRLSVMLQYRWSRYLMCRRQFFARNPRSGRRLCAWCRHFKSAWGTVDCFAASSRRRFQRDAKHCVTHFAKSS